jgi:hypothetical protein
VDPGSSPSLLGEACRSNADCTTGLSCSSISQGYPGGYCTSACTSPSSCGDALCTPIGTDTVCAPTCTSDTQCRQGYGCCATLADVCVPLGACTPAACRRPVETSALSAGVQPFGLKRVNDVVTFPVPTNTGSVTIMQQAQLANLTVIYQNQVIDNSAVPLTITRPDGTLAYDDNADAGISSPDGSTDPSGNYAFYGGATPNTAAFTFPNTSASLSAGVPAGDWKFVVNDYANECTFLSGCNDGGTSGNLYDVTVVTRPLPGGSTVQVAFYIVGEMTTIAGAPFRASNATTDPGVQRMVQTFQALLANAGITANVVFFDVAATDRARFGTNINAQTTGPCDELSQMFTLSGDHPGNTMNVFLVQSLRAADVNGSITVVGIDGTIPGPSSFNGTVHSGAVVSATDLFTGLPNCPGATAPLAPGCGPDKVAYIAAHETGHFLGLFHTTEQEGADFDPISDTAKCPCTTCATTAERAQCGTGNPPLITNDRCLSSPCGGGDNLMFWFLQAGTSRGTISPHQAQVMKLNPLLQ